MQHITFDRIKALHAKEVEYAESRTLQATDELPMSYEEITPAWLTAVLARDTPGAEVVSARPTRAPPAAGASR